VTSSAELVALVAVPCAGDGALQVLQREPFEVEAALFGVQQVRGELGVDGHGGHDPPEPVDGVVEQLRVVGDHLEGRIGERRSQRGEVVSTERVDACGGGIAVGCGDRHRLERGVRRTTRHGGQDATGAVTPSNHVASSPDSSRDGVRSNPAASASSCSPSTSSTKRS
jgi:hypothetical protein